MSQVGRVHALDGHNASNFRHLETWRVLVAVLPFVVLAVPVISVCLACVAGGREHNG